MTGNLFHRKLQIDCYHQKHSFQLKMCQKPFVDRALPGPAGEAYSAPTGPLAGLRGWGPRRGEEGRGMGKRKKENWRGNGKGREKAREKEQGRDRWGMAKSGRKKRRGEVKGREKGIGHGFCLG